MFAKKYRNFAKVMQDIRTNSTNRSNEMNMIISFSETTGKQKREMI